jgi:transcriptional regulator with XRE-family HTH domain
MLEMEKAFGQVIKKYRKLNRLTQEELAHLTSLDRTFISVLERGRRNPTLATAFSIANCLGIPLSELIKEIEDELNKK